MSESLKKSGYRGYAGLLIPVLLAVTVMVLAGCEREAGVESGFTGSPGGHAPSFEVKTFDGGIFNLGAVSGSPVVINFWASWCGPCRIEAAIIQEAYEKFKGSGVRFIGVALQDTPEASGSFIDEFGWSFPVGPDETGEIMRVYKVFGIPKTFIIAKDGRVSYVHSGAITKEILTREIMGVL